MAPPEDLERIVLQPGGGLVPGRSAPGRGAWLCRGSPSCLEVAARRRAFSRALRADVPASAVDGLRSMLAVRARMVRD